MFIPICFAKKLGDAPRQAGGSATGYTHNCFIDMNSSKNFKTPQNLSNIILEFY
jgi:hypothetical protein